MYTPDSRTPKYMKQTLTELKGEIDINSNSRLQCHSFNIKNQTESQRGKKGLEQYYGPKAPTSPI